MLTSCDSSPISLHVLAPSKKVPYKKLSDYKFKLIPVDLPTYEIQNGDTLITISFNEDLKKAVSQRWEVKFTSLDNAKLVNFLSSYNSIVFSELDFSKPLNSNFIIHNHKLNMTFSSTLINKSDSLYILYITYDFPY